jgi:sugar lactone lactonase YvrE
MTRPIAVAAAIFIWAQPASASFTPSLYYSTLSFGQGQVWRANLDGSNPTSIAQPGYDVVGVEADTLHNKLYWSRVNPSTSIYRSNPDGSDVQLVYGNGSQILSMEVDPVGEKIYWTDNIRQKVYRANLDGSQVEAIASAQHPVPSRSLFGLALDHTNSKVYWAEYSDVWRSNLDGSGKELFRYGVSREYYIASLAIDSSANLLYWGGWNSLGVASLSSYGNQLLWQGSGTAFVTDVELDQQHNRVYWTDQSGTLFRSNLDAFSAEALATGSNYAGLAIVPEPSVIALLPIALLLVSFKARRLVICTRP